MLASVIAVFLGICTVVLYVWFFVSRRNKETYDTERNIPLQDDREPIYRGQIEENKDE